MLDAIQSIRAAIRYHRAQVSDYRCWVDDIRLYRAAGVSDPEGEGVPNPEKFMPRCEAFWDKRQRPAEQGKGDPTVNSASAPLPVPQFSDADLTTLSPESLEREYLTLVAGVTAHATKGFLGRTVADDQSLYDLLPETVAWDSSLPPRAHFLENCGRFCAHCQKSPQDLLEWAK